jgi:hypothetical protein
MSRDKPLMLFVWCSCAASRTLALWTGVFHWDADEHGKAVEFGGSDFSHWRNLARFLMSHAPVTK